MPPFFTSGAPLMFHMPVMLIVPAGPAPLVGRTSSPWIATLFTLPMGPMHHLAFGVLVALAALAAVTAATATLMLTWMSKTRRQRLQILRRGDG